MHLKRLELFGFKSFADRTVMNFDHSLTGVVGPNGCGKSNVVDAMRWVLGEQRPTSMRGAEMTDVIFKGSASRPSMSVAEVTMVLDNADGAIPERGAELAITRRVYRSGEGEYQIDGEKVRLKDVKAMLFDTGLGSRGYSVLEQGKIDAVLSANPLDRRAIFEEAAGVSRYRQQRSDVESKLRRVARDLERLDDVLGELRTRERSLKIQAGKAERYVEARDEWRTKGESLARHQLRDLDGRIRDARASVEQDTARADELRALRESAEGEVRGREREGEALTGELGRVSARSSELAGDLRALDERRDLLSKRAASLRETAVAEARRGAELEEKLGERRRELEELTAEAEALAHEVGEAEAALTAKGDELRELQKAARAARVEAAERNETVLGHLHEKTAAKNRLTHLEQSLEPLAERATRARSRMEEAQRTLDDAREVESQARAAQQAARGALAEAEHHEGELEERSQTLAARAREAGDTRNALELERTRLTGRIESLLDRDREREGLESGAKALIDGASARGDATRTPDDGAAPLAQNELLGLLADHLKVATEDARALDAVLGERAEALVVSDATAAERAIDWLRAGELGRVRLVLPGGLTAAHHEYDNHEVGGLTGDPRVLGWLRERIEVTAGFESLADALFEGVALVRDLEAALSLVRERPALVCATPTGDVVDAAGVNGGHREVAHGAVGRRSSAAELEERVTELDARLEVLSSELEVFAREREALAEEQSAAAQDLSTRRGELARARGAEESAVARISDLEEAARVFEAESASVLEEERRVREELEGARAKQTHAEAEFARENELLGETELRRRALDERCEALARDEYQARIAWTRQREKAEGSAHRTADLVRALEEAAHETERTRRLAEEHAISAEADDREGESLSERRATQLEERGKLEQQLEDLRERERVGRGAIDEFRRRAEAVTHELESLQAELAKEQLATQRHELALDELLRRAEEDFELTVDDLRTEFEEDPELAEEGALKALAVDVHELKRRLDKLGPVNLEAVTELEEVSGRLEFLDSQRGDLTRGRVALEESLATINTESERLFLENFEVIRDNFRVIFRQLFGGGKADIVLEEGVPVLEGGIEISARPPGREMLPLGLLSGGQRTLTALALLFSVFQSRPSPFCVLDEVDAALDDANIARFLGMLGGFLDTSQFVVVTHNKGTMAACDVLYGVTMETKGVSRHVSVELDEVDEFVPEATGKAEAGRGAKGARPEPRQLLDFPEEAGLAGRAMALTRTHTPGGSHAPQGNGNPAATSAAEPLVELVPHTAADRVAESVPESVPESELEPESSDVTTSQADGEAPESSEVAESDLTPTP